MSFDVFFQGFLAGKASGTGGAQMLEALSPYIVSEAGSGLRVRIGDGEADLALSEGGMMASHISGNDPWQLLVAGARAANWVILPLGGPTCLTAPGQREELPEELGGEVFFVQSGADVIEVIKGV